MCVTVETRDRLGILRIDHLATMNALSPGVITSLDADLLRLATDSSIRVIFITGTGPAFSAGADIRFMSSASPEECRNYLEQAQQFLQHIETLRVPVVAIVNGVCTGGGCTLAGACDFALAADSATFGEPEAKIGLPGGFGNIPRLLRRVGGATAAELLLTGQIVDAETARQMGLVSRVVPAASLWDEAEKLAQQVAANSPTALAQIKRLLRCDDVSGSMEIDAYITCLDKGEAREGMRAFLEKQPPRW
ncbi:MAG: enoyl-CoA hydratase [Planctomycetaceae bacterium]|nr:enoyl-CoA hydratase [Planctomycetaceae bacterium]MBP61132.1 enoyl-CoA hydratase [Planctomycetaceae bacterium]